MPLHPTLAGVPIRRIAVFRALMLGDLLCATPALRAVRAAWPEAELTLIGLPWTAPLAARLPAVDRFEAFPGHPLLPEIEPDGAAWPGFVARQRAAGYDLLLQLHGSGGIVNEMLAGFGAKRMAGFVEPGAYCAEPALHCDWPMHGHEIERLLALTDHLGLARRGLHLDYAVTDADRDALAATLPEVLAAPFVCVHPGAQLASRRWPPERFAAVADALAAQGFRVVLTGGPQEAALTAEVAGRMRQPALDFSGRTELFTLGALLERARLLVSNDTGVMHVAAALGTPSVAISSGADVARWAPLDAVRHPVLWHAVACRPCGHRVCPTGHECALGVDVEAVVEAAARTLKTASGNRETRDNRPPPVASVTERRLLFGSNRTA